MVIADLVVLPRDAVLEGRVVWADGRPGAELSYGWHSQSHRGYFPDEIHRTGLDEVERIHGTRDLCLINGRYDDGVCDTFCPLPDPDCDEPEDECAADGGECRLWSSDEGYFCVMPS